MIRITIYNEYLHEKTDENVKAIYPEGIHTCIKNVLENAGFENVRTATLDDPDCGLTDEVLDNTDVLFWWGHMGHHRVPDEVVERVYRHVIAGMGMVVLHSGHASKIFRKLTGSDSDQLKWRESNDTEILWTIAQGHPITEGIGENIILDREETYGEHFMVPTPDELIFISWFTGGEVFRSGCVYNRGRGKIFYFRPGHESVPTYYNEKVQRVLINAANYVANKQDTSYKYGWVPATIK